jgi:hypothetical protein
MCGAERPMRARFAARAGGPQARARPADTARALRLAGLRAREGPEGAECYLALRRPQAFRKEAMGSIAEAM